MGALTPHLQEEFSRLAPTGWTARREVGLLAPRTARFLGYAPRADLVLERVDGSRRLWIEFEVSRADPVSNHAKFATAHLFQPQEPTDAFVAMVSPHVARGRRNLAANTVLLMRRVGMAAFQTVLFPQLAPEEVKRLNHLPLESVRRAGLSVGREIERVFHVVDPVLDGPGHAVHFVGDFFEAVANLRRWNEDLQSKANAALWGRRTITYFVFDPGSGLFAPSKFCAYTVLPRLVRGGISREEPSIVGMNVETYAAIDGADQRFDGHKARHHLTANLGMSEGVQGAEPHIEEAFRGWLGRCADHVRVHPKGPVFLTPPVWSQ